jgi:hypothetical protein
MKQLSLLEDNNEQTSLFLLGSDLSIDLQNKSKGKALFYRQGCFIKAVNLKDKVEKSSSLLRLSTSEPGKQSYPKYWESVGRRYITTRKPTNILVQKD